MELDKAEKAKRKVLLEIALAQRDNSVPTANSTAAAEGGYLSVPDLDALKAEADRREEVRMEALRAQLAKRQQQREEAVRKAKEFKESLRLEQQKRTLEAKRMNSIEEKKQESLRKTLRTITRKAWRIWGVRYWYRFQ